MRSRYRVSLGGVHLDSLDNNLLITDVSYPPMKPQRQKIRNANLDGYDYDDEDTYTENTTVTVTFLLRIYNIADRNAACQKVNNWANAGGELKVNDRAGQHLENVECDRFATIASARNWTDPLTLVFTTTGNPFWISNERKRLTLSGKSAKGTLKMDGNARKPVKVKVEAEAKASLSSFQVTVGDTKIKVTGFSLASGKKLVIDYKSNRYLRVRADGKSVMAKVSADSSDLLTAPCGANTAVSYSANAKVAVTVEARGMWI